MRLHPRSLSLCMLLALSVPAASLAWPHSPATGVPVSSAAAYTLTPVLCSDGAGGFFAAWGDYRPPGNGDVYVQHFDARGAELWTHNGILLSGAAGLQYPLDIAPDHFGGVIVLWNDYRAASGYPDLYVGRLSSSGTPQWSSNGVPVVTVGTSKDSPQLGADAFGGAYVAWEDNRASATTQTDIYLQHVDASGALGYAANGTPLCTATGGQYAPSLVVDPFGNCTVAWVDSRGVNPAIYGQRCSSPSPVQWTANGAAICNFASFKYAPRVALGPGNHIVVAWGDYRPGQYEVFAQLVAGYDGSSLWTTNGVQETSGGGQKQLAAMCADGAGGFVAYWTEYVSSYVTAIGASRFDAGGVPQWGSPGVIVSANAGYPYVIKVVPDGAGGTVAAWVDSHADAGDVYAQRLSSAAVARWAPGGAVLANQPLDQQLNGLAVGANGGAFVGYTDNGTGSGARLQAVDEWGYLGAAPVMNDARDVPNDQGGQVKVSWYASPLDVDPLFRNITDYIVYRSVPPQLAASLQARVGSSSTESLTLPGGRSYRHTRFGAQDYFWEDVAHVVPHHLSAYSVVVPTAGDSIAGSNPLTAFMVEALAGTSAFWTSSPDSTYSVDNVPPVAPAPFTGQYAGGVTRMQWNPNAEADLAGYRLYRGTGTAFVPGPGNRIASLTTTSLVDSPGAPAIYKLSAVDVHGNESAHSILVPAGVLDVVAPEAVLFLAAPAPNPAPSGRAATIRFGLSHAGRADVAVFDAAGRRVRTLASGELAAGEHRATWDGLDDGARPVRAGLFFVRLAAEGQVIDRRLARIE